MYLSTVFVPGVIMLFMFLISAYSLGMELKFGRGKEWLGMADNNMVVAILGKYLPQALIFSSIIFFYEFYIYGILHFPHEGNLWDVADGMSIGGDKFGNREGLLPKESGRQYYECDIDYEGGYRNGKRIVYSNDGLIYYTEDHYESFEEIVGE